MVKKMSGGDLTDEQKTMLANLASKGLKYGANTFAKSDMGQEVGGLLSNLASSAFSSLFGNGTSGGAKGDRKRIMANRAIPNRVPNSVRVREMNDVRNYNMNQDRKVFELSKRQVGSESESIKPIDAKDAGAAFKLQTYISKLQQILGQKADLFSQLAATPFTDLNQMKGTTKQSGLLTMMVSKAEFLQAYNEMVAYVGLFFKDIQLDNRVRDRMYSTFFTPLIDQMRQLSQQYPNVFATLPAPSRETRGINPPIPDRSGRVYDIVRDELRDMYSLLNVAADNIQDGIFRPIGVKDVREYSRDNNVNATFAENPAPPGPIIPSKAVQQGQQAIALVDANTRARQAQADELAAENPYNPMSDLSLSPQQQQAYSRLQAFLQSQGRAPNTILPLRSIPQLVADTDAGRMDRDEALGFIGIMFQAGLALGATTVAQNEAVGRAADDDGNLAPLTELLDGRVAPQIQLYNDWVQSRGIMAPPADRPQSPPQARSPPRQRSPSPQQQPAGPAGQKGTQDDANDLVRRYVASQLQAGIPAPEVLNSRRLGSASDLIADIQQMSAGLNVSGNQLKKALPIVRAEMIAQAQQGQAGPAQPQQPPGSPPLAPSPQQPGAAGSGMSGGISHRYMRELDFVPGQMSQFNSAAPPVSIGYGSHHRPKFANEMEQEATRPKGCGGGYYVRQDRAVYNMLGGLGMVNPDSEIGSYQVLRMAGEVGRGMSGGVYLPKEYSVQPAGEKEFFGYGVDGDNDMFGEMGGFGSLKRRLAGGMVNPFAVSRDYHYKPKETSYDDAMDFAYGNHEEANEATQQAHEEEEEKPVDLDENPNPFRVRNENYKVNTGKMKKVSYKMPDK